MPLTKETWLVLLEVRWILRRPLLWCVLVSRAWGQMLKTWVRLLSAEVVVVMLAILRVLFSV